MRIRKSVLSLTILAAATALAMSHHALNGTWKLLPDRSDFGGHPALRSGTVAINDREGNISISREFTFDGGNETYMENFTLDGREGSTIRNGKTFKTKAKWEHDNLMVTTDQDGVQSVEHYWLGPDGSLHLTVETPGHPPMQLEFRRQ